MSIRLRLTVWYSAVLLAGMGLFGCGIWVGLERRLSREVDGRLAQRVEGVRTVFEIEGGSAGPQQMREELSEFLKEVRDVIEVEILDASGAVFLAANAPLPAFPPRPGYGTVYRGRREFRMLARGIEYGGVRYRVLAVAPLDEVRGMMRNLRIVLLLVIPGMLALSCAGGYWISRRALRPVDEITRAAKSITVHSLSKRLPVPATGDELQRLSETWNEFLERLDGAVMRIRQFTADASHELRTPLALIRATAELALRRERNLEEYRQSLREIEDEAERMTGLTESLLVLARADSGSLDLPMKTADLNDIAAEVVRQSETLAERNGVRLRAEFDPRPALATVNDAAVRRLLLILIDNALQHTPAGGTVSVSTEVEKTGTALAVRDSGEGIDPEALPHIFERFYRADKARGNGGAGLGLSIAQAIAQAHGTEIEVESAPGAGARFCVRFPASQTC